MKSIFPLLSKTWFGCGSSLLSQPVHAGLLPKTKFNQQLIKWSKSPGTTFLQMHFMMIGISQTLFARKWKNRLFKWSKIKITFGQESRIERKLPSGKVMAFGKLLNRAWHWKGSHYCSRPFHILTKFSQTKNKWLKIWNGPFPTR